ncbi:MAG: spermidine synthase [Anaerolineae bacterium]
MDAYPETTPELGLPGRSIYLGLGLLSAAALAFEIILTRLFSVTEWYHFAFLAVSVALLGYGASGTLLSLVPRWTRPPTSRRASILAVLFGLGVLVAYLSLNYLPFDSYRIAWQRSQVLYLVLYYMALTIPFFCAGLVTGILLAAYPEHSARVYAANLMGSAAGGLVPFLILPLAGEGAVLVTAALGFLAAALFRAGRRSVADSARRLPARSAGSAVAGLGTGRVAGVVLLLAAGGLLFVLAWQPPTLFRLRLSPYKALSQVLRFPDTEIVWQRWNAFSRVDLVSSSAIRSAPGLSLSYPGELPAQEGLFVDGDDLSPVILAQDLHEFTAYLPVALPYQLRPGGRVLILGPRAGLDLWVALEQGAASAVAVESNPLVVEASRGPYRANNVQVVVEEGRSYARHSRETFDVVHLALTDGYRPVTSGAYSLGERYDLTVEAFGDYLARLRPGGLLVIERWLQLPPSEMLRAGATAVEALRRAGVEDPGRSLVVLRSWQVGLILVKNGAFRQEELASIRGFSQAQGLDLVAMPGLEEEEINQRNILPEPVYYRAFRHLLSDAAALYATSTYQVRPTSDNRPFFFHFFRWGQTRAVLEQLGRTWQPWGGSGYFVLVALLAVALLTSGVLILLPLGVARRARRGLAGPRGRVFVYFGLLGLGFLFAEIPLIQRFILFLGQPTYAFATVAVAILLFSGLGSLASERLSLRWTLPVLILALVLYPLALPFFFRALLGAPLLVRVTVGGLSLAPLGFLMGVPFPSGLAWLREQAAGLVPWAWAINGCTSVLASILAAMMALSAGFSWVLIAAALAYAGAWLALRSEHR